MNFSGNFSSLDFEGFQTVIIVTTFMLVIALVGLVTNTLSAIVWLTQVKTKSAALFIGCLSFTDALYCLATLLSPIMLVFISSPCYWNILQEVILISTEASRILIVAIVAQRWLAISRPLMMTRLCTLHRQLIVLACLFLPIIAIHIYGIYVTWFGEINCFTQPTERFPNVYRILNFAFPVLCFMCMFVFNALLLYSTCNIPQITPSLRSRRWQRDLELRMTVTIFCVSAISMVEFFISVIFLFEMAGFNLEGVVTVKAVIPFLIVVFITRPVNFFVYSCIGKDFRKKLRSLCKY